MLFINNQRQQLFGKNIFTKGCWIGFLENKGYSVYSIKSLYYKKYLAFFLFGIGFAEVLGK